MRIAINTRLLLPKRDGIGWFTAETVRRIVTSHPEHEFFLLFDRHVDLEWKASNMHQVELFPPARHPILWYLFFDWSIPRALRRCKADLFVSTDGWMSLRTSVPTLTVMHDLNFEHATDYLRPSHQRYMKFFFPRFARKATRIATVSEFSKADIARLYGISKDKIDVVYSARNNHMPTTQVNVQQVRQQYTDGHPFFLFVGTISKRKNLTNLLLAFDRFKQTDAQGTKLVIAGLRYWWGDELRQAYEQMQFGSDVLFLGRTSNEVTAQLLQASQALLFVSLFEGFGVPILEGFDADTAVVTSNCTSMPEVAGDAALLVNPTDVEEIASALTTIATRPQLRQELISKGHRQLTRFTWDLTAQLLWDSIEKTIHDACIE